MVISVMVSHLFNSWLTHCKWLKFTVFKKVWGRRVLCHSYSEFDCICTKWRNEWKRTKVKGYCMRLSLYLCTFCISHVCLYVFAFVFENFLVFILLWLKLEFKLITKLRNFLFEIQSHQQLQFYAPNNPIIVKGIFTKYVLLYIHINRSVQFSTTYILV